MKSCGHCQHPLKVGKWKLRRSDICEAGPWCGCFPQLSHKNSSPMKMNLLFLFCPHSLPHLGRSFKNTRRVGCRCWLGLDAADAWHPSSPPPFSSAAVSRPSKPFPFENAQDTQTTPVQPWGHRGPAPENNFSNNLSTSQATNLGAIFGQAKSALNKWRSPAEGELGGSCPWEEAPSLLYHQR